MSFAWKFEPLGAPENYSIVLDRVFAEEAYELVRGDYQRRMNGLGNQVLESEGMDWRNPYRFRGDSMLVTSIHLGDNGKWIATTDNVGQEDLTFYGHNLDTSEEVLLIEKLFDQRHKSTQALLEGDQ